MNKIVNKFLLARDKCMPEIHLKQSGFTHSPCGPFTKNKERIQMYKETEDSRYRYRNELEKACFQHDMAYGDFRDLARRTASDKVLRNKAFKIANNSKYDGCQRGLVSTDYIFFDKKSTGRGIKPMSNQELADELHRPVIEKYKKEKFIHHLKRMFGVLIQMICN